MYDFGSRFYDPQLGRWFTPDPAEQFANPYLAMGNNPVMYVDPDGEFVIAMGAIIGAGVALWANRDNLDQGIGYALSTMAIGAIAGAASSGVGVGVSGAIGGIGFTSGAISGAASGFTGNFLSSAEHAWHNGADFKTGMSAGLRSGGWGALGGAVIGGVISGLHSIKHDGNFFTGDGYTKYNLAELGESGVAGTPPNYTDEYLGKFADRNFPSADEIRKSITLNASSGPTATFAETGHFQIKSGSHAGKLAWGYTRYNAAVRTFDIFISKAALISNQRLYLTMGHEFLHVAYSVSGSPMTVNEEHASIYKWQYDQAKKFYMGGGVRADYLRYKPYWNPSHDKVWKELFPIRNSTSFTW